MLVLLGWVENLEDTVIGGVGIKTGRAGDCRFSDLVEVAVGIGLGILRNRVRFLVGYGVIVAINGRIEACSNVSSETKKKIEIMTYGQQKCADGSVQEHHLIQHFRNLRSCQGRCLQRIQYPWHGLPG